MRSYFVPYIAVAIIVPASLSARSDDIPPLDVRPVCRGIAGQSSLEVGFLGWNVILAAAFSAVTATAINEDRRRTLPEAASFLSGLRSHVCFWHKADMTIMFTNVRSRG